MDSIKQLTSEGKMEESKVAARLEKLVKKLPDSFLDDVKISDEKTLRDKIVALSKEIEDVKETQKADRTLSALKEQLKDLNGGYNDLKKEKTNRLQFIILTLEERGKL